MVKSGTNLGLVDLWSDICPTSPWQTHLMVKSGTNLGQVDLSSDVLPSQNAYS